MLGRVQLIHVKGRQIQVAQSVMSWGRAARQVDIACLRETDLEERCLSMALITLTWRYHNLVALGPDTHEPNFVLNRPLVETREIE